MKKTIVILLLLSTLLCLFSACKKDPEKTTPTGDAETDVPREEISDNLPNKNMENFELRIFTNNPERFTWSDVIIAPEAYNGEDINDAKFERNAYLQERFNFELTVTQGSPTRINDVAEIQNFAMSGDTSTGPHIVMHYDKWVLNSAEYFLDWNDVPYISLGEDYWNPGVSDMYNVRNKQVALSGSFSLGMLGGTTVYLFNKEMYEQYYGEPSSIYGYVTDGEWTIDKFYELALGVVENSDAIWDDTDQFGVFSTPKALYSSLMVGCDIRFVEKMEEDGIPFFSLPSDNYAIEKLQKILKLCQDNDVYYVNAPDVHSDDGKDAFVNGRTLFYVNALNKIPVIRASMEQEFGILPVPKYNTDQKEYRNIGNGGELACLMMTTKEADFENIGIIMEALSFDSHQKLLPIYKDRLLKTRFASDEESRAMLDIIFNTTVGELGINVFEDIVTVPIIQKIYMPKKDAIADTLASMSNSVRGEIAKLLRNIK